MGGSAWPNRLVHQLLTASSVRLPSWPTSQAPSPRAIGSSGRVSGCSRICVQGCQSTARSRERQSAAAPEPASFRIRSEEHTSELQSLMRISYAVFCLKKKKQTTGHIKQLPELPI